MSNQNKAGRNKEAIHSRIPEPLKQQLQKVSGLPFDQIANRGMKIKILDSLKTFIKDFVDGYNIGQEEGDQLIDIGPDNLDRAVFNREPKGFTRPTAETLTRYAFNGEKGWDEFIAKYTQENPDDRKLYLFPNEILDSSEIQISDHLDNQKDSLLDEYINRLTAQFKYVSLGFENDITKVSIDSLKAPFLGKRQRVENLRENYYETSAEKFSWEQILETDNETLIVGPCGAGKTTLCKMMFCTYAARYKQGEKIFPLYINLEDFTDIEACLRNICPSGNIKPHLENYHIIYICDGLNSIKHDLLLRIEEILQIRRTFNSYKLVITSRDGNLIRSFLNVGMPCYKLEGNTEYLPLLLLKESAQIEKFSEWKYQKSYVSGMDGNYLYTTSLILIYLQERNNLPLTHSRILKKIYEEIFFRTWRKKDIKEEFLTTFKIRDSDILNLLSIVAIVDQERSLFHSKENRKYYVDEIMVRDVAGITWECMQNIIQKSLSCNEEVADQIISVLVESGLLWLSHRGFYQLENFLIQNYFHAKGSMLICFENQSLIFGKRFQKKIIKKFFKRYSIYSFELVAGLLEHPALVLKIWQAELSPSLHWTLYFRSEHQNKLIFYGVTISLLKEKFHREYKSVIDQLKYILEISFTTKNNSIISFMAGYLDTRHLFDKDAFVLCIFEDNWLDIALTVFDTCEPYSFWDARSVSYAMSLGGTHITFVYPKHRFNYLKKSDPKKLLVNLWNFFSNTHEYSCFLEEITPSNRINEICAEFWRAFENFSELKPEIDKLANLLLDCYLSNRFFETYLAERFLISSEARVINELLRTKVASLIQTSNSNLKSKYEALMALIKVPE